MSTITIVGSQGPLVCAVEDTFHWLLGCEHPGLALLAGMSPASTMEKVIPPTAYRSGHDLSSE